MSKHRIFRETTSVPAKRSIAGIQELLASTGARSIAIDYVGGKPAILQFVLETPRGSQAYRLPARVNAIVEILRRNHSRMAQSDIEDRAERIAWRQLLAWTQAQLALIECEMVRPEEIFLPYALNAAGETLFEFIDSGKGKKLLEVGRP